MILRGYKKARRLTELRLAELERQMSHIEDVTGCHTDEELPPVEEPTVKEALLAQERIIKHLLVTFDVMVPGFSIAGFREALRPLDDDLMQSATVDIEPDDQERLLLIMENIIPDPLPRQTSQRNKPGKFRPILVPKEPDPDA